MSENMLLGILKEAIYLSMKIGGPFLVTALVVGLLISIIQATTQIQEQTLTFVPKVITIAIVGLLFSNFIINTIKSFTFDLFELIGKL